MWMKSNVKLDSVLFQVGVLHQKFKMHSAA